MLAEARLKILQDLIKSASKEETHLDQWVFEWSCGQWKRPMAWKRSSGNWS